MCPRGIPAANRTRTIGVEPHFPIENPRSTLGYELKTPVRPQIKFIITPELVHAKKL
jgi:hypothetical protein